VSNIQSQANPLNEIVSRSSVLVSLLSYGNFVSKERYKYLSGSRNTVVSIMQSRLKKMSSSLHVHPSLYAIPSALIKNKNLFVPHFMVKGALLYEGILTLFDRVKRNFVCKLEVKWIQRNRI
jgi:hypothetical protein